MSSWTRGGRLQFFGLFRQFRKMTWLLAVVTCSGHVLAAVCGVSHPTTRTGRGHLGLHFQWSGVSVTSRSATHEMHLSGRFTLKILGAALCRLHGLCSRQGLDKIEFRVGQELALRALVQASTHKVLT